MFVCFFVFVGLYALQWIYLPRNMLGFLSFFFFLAETLIGFIGNTCVYSTVSGQNGCCNKRSIIVI